VGRLRVVLLPLPAGERAGERGSPIWYPLRHAKTRALQYRCRPQASAGPVAARGCAVGASSRKAARGDQVSPAASDRIVGSWPAMLPRTWMVLFRRIGEFLKRGLGRGRRRRRGLRLDEPEAQARFSCVLKRQPSLALRARRRHLLPAGEKERAGRRRVFLLPLPGGGEGGSSCISSGVNPACQRRRRETSEPAAISSRPEAGAGTTKVSYADEPPTLMTTRSKPETMKSLAAIGWIRLA